MDVEKNVISLSGGKDSTALLLHALEKETENIVPVFADTGNEHKLTYDYLEYLERILNIKIIRVKAVFNQQIAKKREYIKHFWIQEDIPQQIIEDALSVLEPTEVPFLDLCLWKGRFPSTMAAFCSTALKRKLCTLYTKLTNPKLFTLLTKNNESKTVHTVNKNNESKTVHTVNKNSRPAFL